MSGPLSKEKFQAILRAVCAKDTSADPDGWTPENPTWGHCAVATLITQDIFGGRIMRGSLESTPFAKMRSHYWNQFLEANPAEGACPPDNFDTTAEQFVSVEDDKNFFFHLYMHGEERTRAYLQSSSETRGRYKTLMGRLLKAVHNSNALFNDPLYQACMWQALNGLCQKMKFGCVVTHRAHRTIDNPLGIVGAACNKTIDPLKSLCEGECIRNTIQSRTESMIGACGHAEEWAMEEVIRKGVSLQQCEMYIAGFDVRKPSAYIKEEAVHTCLRCSTQMWMHQIGRIYVPVSHRWEGISAEEAITGARAYALKEKKV